MWFFAAAVCLATLQVEGRPDPLTVSAAISLTDALEAAARAFVAAGGHPVRFNFGGSNTLARQIVSGAPVDVYISADEMQMDVVARAGAIDPASRVDLVGNRLAIMTRAGLAPVSDPHALARPEIRRIAVGDPAAVPAGVYARKFLQAAGLWERLQPKTVPVSNVRAALAAVENGSVDAAIVYESDTIVATGAVATAIVSGPAAPRIVYPAAIVTGSRNRAQAERFLSFLRGPEAAAIFKRYRFIPLIGR